MEEATEPDAAALAAAYEAVVGPPKLEADVAVAAGSARTRAPASSTLPLAVMAHDTGFAEVVAVSGNVLAVASQDSAPGLRILRRGEQGWREEVRLDPFDRRPLHHRVSLSLDADTLAVGLPPQASLPGLAGVVRTYDRSGATWLEGPVLSEPPSAESGYFGISIALDGDTLAVGAPYASTGGLVYVYARRTSAWALTAELAGKTAGDAFGQSVALDGDTLAVGAPGDDGAAGSDGRPTAWGAGAVHVFSRAGNDWSAAATVRASDVPARWEPTCHGMGCMQLPRAVEQLGASVALSGDTLIAGAPGGGEPREPSESALATGPGAVHVFVREGSRRAHDWREAAVLAAPDGSRRFGATVALAGARIVAGAPDSQPVPGALPLQVEVATVAVFAPAAGEVGWARDVQVRTPIEPSGQLVHLGASGDVLAIAGFRRGPDGGFVEVVDLGGQP